MPEVGTLLCAERLGTLLCAERFPLSCARGNCIGVGRTFPACRSGGVTWHAEGRELDSSKVVTFSRAATDIPCSASKELRPEHYGHLRRAPHPVGLVKSRHF